MGPADHREGDRLTELEHRVEWHEIGRGRSSLFGRGSQAEHERPLPQLLLWRQGYGRVGGAIKQAERLLAEGITEGEGGAGGERIDSGVDQPGCRGRAQAAEQHRLHAIDAL